MKMRRTAALLASALLLASGSTAASGNRPRSFEVDFNKCLARLSQLGSGNGAKSFRFSGGYR